MASDRSPVARALPRVGATTDPSTSSEADGTGSPDSAFGGAWTELDDAVAARDLLGDCWTSLCDADGFTSRIVIENDHRGRLEVRADWPGQSLSDANEAALRFATHLKKAFDQAVLIAAQQVSGVAEAPNPDAHRMLLCRSGSEFWATVAAGAFRGLRPDQVRALERLQPYPIAPGDDADSAFLIRTLMRHLAEMLAPGRASDRPRVAAWAHSAAPEIEVEPPGELLGSASTGDGVLEQVRTTAKFSFSNASPAQICGNPHLAFDMIFNDEPFPADPDDNLMARSAMLIAIAREFIRGMERSVTAPRRRSLATAVRPTDGSPWEPLDIETFADGTDIESALAASDLGLARYRDPDGNIAMLLRSGNVVYSRPIPPALPLDSNIPQGTAAENASLAAASMWGLPDFVMRSRSVQKGTGSREIGDGTIITGQRGLAVQVKSREASARSLERETSWVLKNAAEGARQAAGTVRSLRAAPVDLINGRGRTVRCDAAEIEWVAVIIVDHPSPPEVLATPTGKDDLPIVVLVRHDWDFLFDQLRSVSAVVEYLHRVARLPPRPLGNESTRYFELARADEEATERPPAAWTASMGAQPVSRPILPIAPASSSDTTGHTVFRIILEEIATTEIDRDERERLESLALIDRFSVVERAALGRLLLTQLDEVMEAPTGETMWRFRKVLQDSGALQLAFGVCSNFTEVHREAFAQWAMLRHHDFVEAGLAPAHVTPRTVAVLLTPRYDGYKPWDTTMVAMQGDLALEPEDVTHMRALWDREHDRESLASPSGP